MGSTTLSEDYRLCLERELRRGRAGVCGDPSLRAVLWQILVEDFDLHGALQDDALALLTDGLWGRADLAPALRGLARAFELLELAAVHLYLLPWRKEFTTIKTFSGGYVHVLKGALSEDLLTRSFQKMGYARKDNHSLTVTAPAPARQLVQVALGCFALRLECEIMDEVLARLGTSLLPAEALLEARRASGDVASCVAWLQQRLARPEEPPPLPPRSSLAAFGCPLDLYRDLAEDEISEEESSLYCQAPPQPMKSSPLPSATSAHEEQAYETPLWEQSAQVWGIGGPAWEASADSPPYGALEEQPEPPPFSFLTLRQELGRPADFASPEDFAGHSCLRSGVLQPSLGEPLRRPWLSRSRTDTLDGAPWARP
ncbi:spermatogenesis-associated protein 2-like protein [Echinops telfairi]|uniref:Spermatogenesis-associated protein 2-like protein n=1 Tax=Echinops telfairi TaxID=9371 RepID=A0ABM0IPI9_ECHTE|nr:spermatogenesis-associated protein 2-like protein [Echinops telfairi]